MSFSLKKFFWILLFLLTVLIGTCSDSVQAQTGGGKGLEFDFDRIPTFNPVGGEKIPLTGKSGSENKFAPKNTSGSAENGSSKSIAIPENSGIEHFNSYLIQSSNNPFSGDLDKDQKTIGWFIVQIDLKPDFNIYSMTQKAGAVPTKIKIDAIENDNGLPIKLGPFYQFGPTTLSDLYGNVLEKLKGKNGWIAPVLVNGSLLKNEFDALKKDGSVWPDHLTVAASFSALACTSGENGICNPVRFSFRAVADKNMDPASIETLLEKAVKQRDLFKNSSPISGQLTRNSSSERSDQNVSDKSTGSTTADSASQTAVSSDQKPLSAGTAFSIWVPIFAFLGGLILNVMPCVLPVIGLKIISFFQQAGQSRGRAFRLNLWYTGGILTVFLLLAFMSVGLSYLFTYGLFQIVMSLIVFAMALNMMGIWEIRLPAFLGGKKSNDLMDQEGAGGAYFKGIITTLLAIPCGAPLLSPTLAWTNTMIQEGRSVIVVPIYLLIGLGMASPYLLMGARPELLRFLPKPGLWMENFRVIMGFVLLGAVIWILFSMPTAAWILPTITVLFALWFGCWFIGSIPFDASPKIRLRRWTISLFLLTASVLISFDLPRIPMPFTIQSAVEAKMTRWAIRAEREGKLVQKHWKLFEPADLKLIGKENKTIIIDFTADWCPNCKVLENTILHTDDFLDLVDRKGIVTLTADCTNQSADTEEMKTINQLLDENGGRQVPTIMIFKPGKEKPEILRGLFTRKTLEDLL